VKLSYELIGNSGINARVVRGSKAVVEIKYLTMAEGFQKLVESLQAEISNLRAQVSPSRPTATKDLSLISLIPKWSRTEKSVSVKEFFEIVESSAKIRNWSEFDKIQITVLKLTEVAKSIL